MTHIIKNTHEPIIKEELFNRVQKLIEERQPKNQAAQITASQYLLSGLIRCGKCRGAHGVTGYGRDRKYAYYNCITYFKKGKDTCAGRRIRADELDKEIIERLKELKNQKDTLQEEIAYYESLNTQNQPVYITRSMIDKFRKEMEQIFMGDNVQEKRDFLKKFIEKIIVKEEKIEIVYYAPRTTFLS